LAIMAAKRLGRLRPPDAAIARGLLSAHWAARLQPLRAGPLAALLPADSELWLDGGHNPAAGAMLARSLPELARGRPIDLVLGMLVTKDLDAFIRPLQPLVRQIRTVPIPGESAGRDPIAMAAAIGGGATPAATVEAAIRELVGSAPAPSLILICGSLYLAGHVLRAYGEAAA
jgi:dihydrofolate synthase/folylpolyglutamate synthase